MTSWSPGWPTLPCSTAEPKAVQALCEPEGRGDLSITHIMPRSALGCRRSPGGQPVGFNRCAQGARRAFPMVSGIRASCAAGPRPNSPNGESLGAAGVTLLLMRTRAREGW